VNSIFGIENYGIILLVALPFLPLLFSGTKFSMVDMNTKVIIIVVGVIAGTAIAIWLWRRSSKQNFIPATYKDYKSGFLPSHQGPYFQNMPPSLKVENTYHQYIANECGGDYGNYECRQKAYLKTMKDGTFDKADLICQRYKNDEDAYYGCLDGVYGNYLWMDRDVGTEACACPGGRTGVYRANGECFCPSERPLHDRRPVDENDQIVNRL
jgi:hypothetical protein